MAAFPQYVLLLLFSALIIDLSYAQRVSPRRQQQMKDTLHAGLSEADKHTILLMHNQGSTPFDICETLDYLKSEEEVTRIISDLKDEHESSLKQINEGRKNAKLPPKVRSQ